MINCNECKAWYIKTYTSCPKCDGKCRTVEMDEYSPKYPNIAKDECKI